MTHNQCEPTDRQREIMAAVDRSGGNVSAAARSLGVTRTCVKMALHAVRVKRIRRNQASFADSLPPDVSTGNVAPSPGSGTPLGHR